MANADRHFRLSRLDRSYIGPVKVSASNAVFTKQSFATINATLATGTQPDFARNLIYNLSITHGTASSASVIQGTLNVLGYNARNEVTSESVNLGSNGLASAASSVGSVLFQRVETISVSSFSLHTAFSASSNSVGLSIGVGNIIGLPVPITDTRAVPNAWIGTIAQYSSVGIGASTASSTLSYTVRTGNVGQAGISFSNALATNTPVMADIFHSRANK